MPAHVQHLRTPAPVLRGLRSQPLHQGFQRLVAGGELGVVVDFASPDRRPCRTRDGRVCRAFRAFWMASLNCLAVAGSVCLMSSSRKLPSWKFTSDRMPFSGRMRLVMLRRSSSSRCSSVLNDSCVRWLKNCRNSASWAGRPSLTIAWYRDSNSPAAPIEVPWSAEMAASPFAHEALEHAGQPLGGRLPARFGRVQLVEQPGPDAVGQVVQLVHLRDFAEAVRSTVPAL